LISCCFLGESQQLGVVDLHGVSVGHLALIALLLLLVHLFVAAQYAVIVVAKDVAEDVVHGAGGARATTGFASAARARHEFHEAEGKCA